jgi:GDPmannose 4,6-dehydratase
MLQRPSASDYVVATGQSHTGEEFAAAAFASVGLDWREYTVRDTALLRPADHEQGWADPAKAQAELGWRARSKMPEVVAMMVRAESDPSAPL